MDVSQVLCLFTRRLPLVPPSEDAAELVGVSTEGPKSSLWLGPLFLPLSMFLDQHQRQPSGQIIRALMFPLTAACSGCGGGGGGRGVSVC